MKISTSIELSLKTLADNKKKNILTIITILILSIIMMSILFIGVGAYKNINKAKKIYVLNEEISIHISNAKSDDGIIKLCNTSKIKNSTYYYSSVFGICLIDFKESDLTFLEISESREVNGNSNDILINFELKDEYNIGDEYVLEDNNYIVAGYLGENSPFSYAIDFTYNYKKYDITNLSIVYIYRDGDNISKHINSLEDLVPIAKKYYDANQIAMDNLITYKDLTDYSNIILIVCIVIAIISVLSTIGILYNSISIYIEQSKSLITIFKTFGMSKKELVMYSYIGVLICALISTILSTIIIICSLPLFKILGNQFVTMFDSGNYAIIKSKFIYDSSFYWYIPVISYLIHAIVLYLIVNKKIRNIHSKQLNELYLETLK